MRFLAHLLIVPCAAALCACGGGAANQPIKPSSPLTAADQAVFANAVDLLADPGAIDGAWADSWKQDLQTRTKRADTIAVVRIQTIIADLDPKRRESLRLTPVPQRVMTGRLPEGTDLRSSAGQLGYDSIRVNREQLLRDEFVLFLKWVLDANGQLSSVWHLAPASEPILELIEEALGVSARTESHVIIRHE